MIEWKYTNHPCKYTGMVEPLDKDVKPFIRFVVSYFHYSEDNRGWAFSINGTQPVKEFYDSADMAKQKCIEYFKGLGQSV